MIKHFDIAQAQTLIERKGIDVVSPWKKHELFLDTNENNFPDSYEKLIEVRKDVLRKYAVASNPSESFLRRLRAFLGASTAAGRGAKAIKDFVLLFVPYGQKISTVTEFVTERIIKPQQNNRKMESTKDKILRIINQPSTKAAITGILTAIGLVFGLGVDAGELASKLTESATGIVTGTFGIYFVYRTIRNAITDDEKELKSA